MSTDYICKYYNNGGNAIGTERPWYPQDCWLSAIGKIDGKTLEPLNPTVHSPVHYRVTAYR
jgi:hypothetical protein